MRTEFDNLNVTAMGRHQPSIGKRSLIAALLAGSLMLSGAASASDTPSASVRFERGELASEGGLERVHERILRAATEACRMHGVRDVARLRIQQECRNDMTRELLAAIDSERLNQFHAQRSTRRLNGAS